MRMFTYKEKTLIFAVITVDALLMAAACQTE